MRRNWFEGLARCGIALLLVFIGATLAIAGSYLIFLGGSAYYLVVGGAVLVSGTLIWRGDRRGTWVYGAMLVGTAIWAFAEVGLNGWALAPRLIGPLVVGLLLLLPVIQRGLDRAPLARRGGQIALGAVTDINADNVSQLKVAWTFRTGETRGNAKSGLETTPIKIGDTLYACDGTNRVFALDADTARLKWAFDPKVNLTGLIVKACRGVAYFKVPQAVPKTDCSERILTTAIDAKLWAIDAHTGKRCRSFGRNGVVDLSRGMGRYIAGYYLVTSAPTVASGRVVLGGWVTDNQMTGAPSGVVRAFNATTGAFVWAWDIGRPGKENVEPGPGESYTHGTPNVWAPPSADEALGLVYLPTGNATPDFWGGHRTEAMNKYSSAIVAVEAGTGRVRWSFQTVHHDLWDYDVPSQPTLVDLPDGRGGTTPALVQTTKRAQVFVLDRRTGRPERAAPQGAAPGDRLAPTQPYSTVSSLAGPALTEAMMWGVTPLDQLWCRIKYREARYQGEFTPPGETPYIQYPGYSGGSSWGGVSVDPERAILTFNVNRFAQYGYLVRRAAADRMGLRPMTGAPEGEALMTAPQMGTPFAAVIGPFLSPLQVPCQQPPFGMVGAIDLQRGKMLWTRSFGTSRDSGPLGIPTYLPIPLGAPNTGGSMTTRSGLMFIGASQERALRAFDINSGRELWRSRIPAGAQATPMTYRSNRTGRQFVVVAAGGNAVINSRKGDYIIGYT